MNEVMRYPVIVGLLSLLALWLAARLGATFRTRPLGLGDDTVGDFGH
jgi:hypothetical protein